MKLKLFVAAAVAAFTSVPAIAGGYLTNTNQSVSFLRNPSQDAMIGISALYNNPAGISFLNEGFHFAANIQSAHQTRDIRSTFGPFAYGKNNNGQMTKNFQGVADAPVVPSIQAAYNWGKWSANFNFAIGGGGGKCTFDQGLGSFESVVSMLPAVGSSLGIQSYDYESYMKGRQYIFNFQFGGNYKFNDKLSAFVGLRLNYATNNYYGYVRNIQIAFASAPTDYVGASGHFTNLSQQAAYGAGVAAEKAQEYATIAQQAASAGNAEAAAQAQAAAQQYAAAAQDYKAKAVTAGTLGVATQDITLNCDQTGWGLTPVIGIDYRPSKQWNFAAKYEFPTRLRLKNKSANSESAANLAQLAQFKDGEEVAEDIPALFTIGAQYSPIDEVRFNIGAHYFFDKQATKYNDTQKLLNNGSWEVTLGAEYDFCKNWTVSAGWQNTNYGNTDAYMKDLSFTTNSNSIGAGVKWQINKTLAVEAAYFHTFYSTYEKTSNNYNNASNIVALAAGADAANALIESGKLAGKDEFTRSNRVFGLGVTLDF